MNPRIALVGNPNVGKSVLFGFLTGRYVSVANYPGTTTEVARGPAFFNRREVILIDTPGINTLVPTSEDERVSRDILLEEAVDGVIQVADAKNLRRALFLSLQLAESGLPFVLDLNMEDEAESRGIAIDKSRLAALLGVPVVGTVAIEKRGLDELRKSLSLLTPPPAPLTYSPDIEEALLKIEGLLPSTRFSRRSIALMILSGDRSLEGWLHRHLKAADLQTIEKSRASLARRFAEPLSYRIAQQRFEKVDGILREVLRQEAPERRGFREWFGRIAMHPLWGFPVLLATLAALYGFVGRLGAQTGVDWLEDRLFGRFINPAATELFSKIFFFSPMLRDLFVGPYGMITMALTYAFAIILPIVLTFFLFFSVIEDSGYLPRLAVMLNRLFRIIGLNGKAVVPMVLGLGCDTMATMSARILDTKKEKIILTLLLALGIPCSAQLGIILAMLGALPIWATGVWLGVVIGSLAAVGWLAARLLPGGRSDFVVEIPPIRRPTLTNIFKKTAARLEWYLKEVTPLFVIGTFVLFLLDRLRLLPLIQRMADPLVVGFLDLPPEGTEAFLLGFLRRDYGATRFFDLFGEGRLDAIQATVALIVMTLFVPCLANLLMIVKERGGRIATAIVLFIYPFAFLVGGLVNGGLR